MYIYDGVRHLGFINLILCAKDATELLKQVARFKLSQSGYSTRNGTTGQSQYTLNKCAKAHIVIRWRPKKNVQLLICVNS